MSMNKTCPISRRTPVCSEDTENSLLFCILRRERCDDFLEARIPAQRIPKRTQTEPPVRWTTRLPHNQLQLLNGEVSLPNSRTHQGKISDRVWALKDTLHKFEPPLSFLNRFLLAPELSIDHGQSKERLPVVGLPSGDLLLVTTCGNEGGLGGRHVPFQSCR